MWVRTQGTGPDRRALGRHVVALTTAFQEPIQPGLVLQLRVLGLHRLELDRDLLPENKASAKMH